MSGETWRVLPSGPRYEVSDLGRVRIIASGRVLITRTPADIYARANIDGRARRVHTLVAEAFLGPRPSGHHVDHINADPRDNRLANLRYLTAGDNARRGHDKMRETWSREDMRARSRVVARRSWSDPAYRERHSGAAASNAKLTADQVAEIRGLLSEGRSLCSVARRFSVTSGTIAHIHHGRTWHHAGAVAHP